MGDRDVSAGVVELSGEISPEGLPCIGRGRNGAVYRLDGERIVKVFPREQSAAVKREQQNAETARALGVPTARVYGTVRCGEQLGLVFEMLFGRSLREVIAEEPGAIEPLVAKAALLLRRLNGLAVPRGALPSMADIYRRRAENLDDYLTREEIGLLLAFIASIPERGTFLHGDFHRGNLLVEGGELSLIDMADCAFGHPLYDVLGVYTLGPGIVKTMPPGAVKGIIGWEIPTVMRVWEVFRRTYFRTERPEELAEIEAMLEAYAWLRQLTFLKIVTAFTEEFRLQTVRSARERFFPRIGEYGESFAGWMDRM